MTKIALVFRHSIRTEINADGSGGILTEDGKRAAQNVGSKIKIGSTPIKYYATDVQRCIDTCKNIEGGRTGNFNITVNKSPVINGKKILDGGYFWNGNANPYINGQGGFSAWALGLCKIENMLDPKEWSKKWLDQMLSVIPNGLSCWCSHDSQVVPLLFNLTGLDQAESERLCNLNNWGPYRNQWDVEYTSLPWTSPLTGIAIINKDDNITVKRIKGLKHGLFAAGDYTHDFAHGII